MHEPQRFQGWVTGPRSSWHALKWVFATFVDKEGWRYAKQLAFFATLFDGFRVIQPWIMGYGLAMIATGNWNQVLVAFGAFVIANILQDICNYRVAGLREYLEGRVAQRLDLVISKEFLTKEMGLHMDRHDLLCEAVLNKGREHATILLKTVLQPITENIPAMLLTLIALFVVAPGPACFIIFTMGIVALLGTRGSRRLVAGLEPIDGEFSALARYRNERYASLERVKTNEKETEEIALMDTRYGLSLTKERGVIAIFIRGIQWRQLVIQAGYATVVGYVGWGVYQGHRSVPDLVSVMSWCWTVLANVRSLNAPSRAIAKATASVLRLKEALELPRQVFNAPDATPLVADASLTIAFEGVTHRYKEGSSVLMDVSFKMEPGQRVALLGPSGAGKSTLVRLLQRFMDPSEGRITVNGIDLRQIKLESWQHLLAYIPQRPQVLDGTLRDNLLYGLNQEARATFTDEKLWEMMRRFRVDFGKRLDQGLNTKVGKHGIELSGGEQQRVMIAAAAIRRPRFMIIDEATSSLDAESQRAVQEALDELLHDGTGAIVIAHRLSTVQHSCNRFVYLRPAGSEPNTPQVGAIADSMGELMDLSDDFRTIALLEGVTPAKA